MLNTQTLAQLEASQNLVINKWGCTMVYGIENLDINLEDSLPWLEVEGKISPNDANELIQDLANAMNIRILYNRLEFSPGEDSCTLYAVYDINSDLAEKIGPNAPIPAFSDDPETKEYMVGYGKEILPADCKKL